MNKVIKFNFIEEYSPYPGGRYIRLGEFSGEDFRETVLREVFKNNDKIIINASGIKTSFTPSFLDEAFGELADEYKLEKFNETIELFSDTNPNLKDKMMYYVNRALKKNE